MEPNVAALTCTRCGRSDPGAADPGEYTCPACGDIREVELDWEVVSRRISRASLAADPRFDVRRYLPLLPVPEGAPLTPLTVGWTPVYEAPRLAAELGIARAFVKDEGRQPTGSFKDRASFVGVARAAHQGHRIVAAASTGNAATSLAGLAASLGLTAHIFVPASAPEAKVAQLLTYGAKVFLITGDYDATYDFCQQAVARFGWYNRSAAVNPHLVEGKKTCGHEIGEQMAPIVVPDWVAMSVGDGCSLAGTAKGLEEMQRLGVIDRVPRMLAVQAEGAAPLTTAWAAGTEDVVRIPAKTCADSINVGMPRNPLKALRAVRRTEGAFVNVSDEAILGWIPRLAQLSGVFGEPAAVTAVAGVEAARRSGVIAPGESVLAVISGSGLKDVRSAMRAVTLPAPLEPDLAALEARLGEGR